MRTYKFSAELCSRAEKKFAARFSTLEQLLEYALRELVRDDAAQTDEREQRMIEQRAEGLGLFVRLHDATTCRDSVTLRASEEKST